MMVKQITEIESEISQALDGHPDGEIFRRESVICVVGRPVISSFTIIP